MIVPKFHPHARLHVTGRDGTLELSRNAGETEVMQHDEQPRRQPEPEEANAYKADNSGKVIVIIQVNEFRLPEVLRHIEAGKIVRVILPQQRPASE